MKTSMRVALGLACFLALAATAPAAQDRLRAEHELHLLKAKASPLDNFQRWAATHAKEYLKDPVELARRFGVWLENL
jgi:hypothetical protein